MDRRRDRDASPAERAITEINCGIYALRRSSRSSTALDAHRHRQQAGRVLPAGFDRDLSKRSAPSSTWTVERAEEIRGINSRAELAEVSRHGSPAEERRVDGRAASRLIDPATTYVDSDVVVGADTVMHPVRDPRRADADWRGVRNPRRRPHRQFHHWRSRAGPQPHGHRRIHGRRRAHSSGRSRTSGPVRSVGEESHVGNFVELKKTRTRGRAPRPAICPILAMRRSAPESNIGAGTITCNYDGETKHQTMIGDGVFVGSDSTLVAPVTIGDGGLHRRRLGDHRTTCPPAPSASPAAGRRTRPAGWRAGRQDDYAGDPKKQRRTETCAESSATSDTSPSSAHPRGAAPARISRLRLGRRRRGAQRCARRSAAARASSATSNRRIADQAARRRVRPRPYALGDARAADRRERPPAPRLQRPHRGGAQRHHRELPRAQARAGGEGHKFESETDTEVVAHLVERSGRTTGSRTPCCARWRACAGCSRWCCSRPTTRRSSSPCATARRSSSAWATASTSWPPTCRPS